MNTTINSEGWRLQTLEIRFNDWGEYKGKYTGAVRFQNKENEAFLFNLSPEEVAQYIHIIKDKIGSSANHLGEKIVQSLNLLPKSESSTLIGEEIPHEPS